MQVGKKTGPCSKASHFHVCLSAYNFSREKSTPKVLLGAANSPFCRTKAWQGGITSIWRTGLCTPHTGAVRTEVPDPGKMAHEGSVRY